MQSFDSARPKKITFIWWAVTFSLLLVTSLGASQRAYRMPIPYNPNPVAGRLYLQPIDTHEDQCINGFEGEVAYGEASDYNIYFVAEGEDPRMTVNTRMLLLKAAYGDYWMGYGVEAGVHLRIHQDERENFLSSVLKNYHEFMGFGNIPEAGAYFGGIGNNGCDVIGKSGEIFLTTLQMYAKIQLLEDGGDETRRPNLSIKTSMRAPLSGKPFDSMGGAISLGASKQIRKRIAWIGAMGMVFQDIDQRDFRAENLHVEKWVGDALTGIVWDMGKSEGWYLSTALRGSSKRVAYRGNSVSAGNAYVVHLLLAYRRIMAHGAPMEFFMNVNEDIPGFGHGLEPDVCAQAGVSVRVF